ncbi:MAG: winged helix-turn-helix domain-containing protein, partial [Kangiellaceae bacterium]|nr:winged helix-turn-helix domain-containing protein [Kangiellaceae bacterium]
MDSKLIYQFGRFHLDPKSQTFYFQSDEIKLEPRIFDVLHLMLQRPSEVITKDEFFEYVWQGKVVSDWALSRAIKVLRKTLLKYHEQELVKTLYGRGYLFTPEVKTISQNDFVNANQNTEPNTELNTEPKQNTEQQNSFNEVGNESVKEMIAENQESNSINPQADQPS